MTRVTNRSRADWASHALEIFVQQTFGGRSTRDLHPSDLQDAVADLIADLGHYVDRRFRRRLAYSELVARGIGMWSAERSCPRQDPGDNHDVSILIHPEGRR